MKVVAYILLVTSLVGIEAMAKPTANAPYLEIVSSLCRSSNLGELKKFKSDLVGVICVTGEDRPQQCFYRTGEVHVGKAFYGFENTNCQLKRDVSKPLVSNFSSPVEILNQVVCRDANQQVICSRSINTYEEIQISNMDGATGPFGNWPTGDLRWHK